MEGLQEAPPTLMFSSNLIDTIYSAQEQSGNKRHELREEHLTMCIYLFAEMGGGCNDYNGGQEPQRDHLALDK
jgi:hypothetical protein